jgi:hypothetical protein
MTVTANADGLDVVLPIAEAEVVDDENPGERKSTPLYEPHQIKANDPDVIVVEPLPLV